MSVEMSLAELLSVVDTYTQKMEEYADLLRTYIVQKTTDQGIPIEIIMEKKEFDEKLEIYNNLIDVVSKLKAIINLKNNENLENGKNLALRSLIDNQINLFVTFSSFTQQKTSKVVETSTYNAVTKLYDKGNIVEKMVCHLPRRETSQKLSSLQKFKKKIQNDIHKYNHTTNVSVSKELLELV